MRTCINLLIMYSCMYQVLYMHTGHHIFLTIIFLCVPLKSTRYGNWTDMCPEEDQARE